MNKILLTFDVEEFDAAIEYGNNISLEEQLEVSTKGLLALQKMLDRLQVTSTIFTTGVYAMHNQSLIKELSLKHEIASHGMYHGSMDPKVDLAGSRKVLEEITGQTITGFRMARMMPIEEEDILKAGYVYNSSLNPTYIPGRYNHLDKPMTPFFENGVLNIPASVSPTLRIPLFWLAFKNFPLPLFKMLSLNALQENGFLNIYFHPWEFTDLSAYKMPGYVKKFSKGLLLERLETYLSWLKDKGEFITMNEYAKIFQ
ncbi:protein of unknown function [Pseudarcicella hirudinis]|uniref:NodB homology domain-containing protein n=1 Tax=Pseudarcicella hirudinis TaxID=1079859 RepID=A0A1I5QDH2_9BACT|nr:DUF3473 domain-containing protein [Pseudarcicella hirudinis]SFP44020.1 protein of unknown function [Pseudarcicella hirudinis]